MKPGPGIWAAIRRQRSFESRRLLNRSLSLLNSSLVVGVSTLCLDPVCFGSGWSCFKSSWINTRRVQDKSGEDFCFGWKWIDFVVTPNWERKVSCYGGNLKLYFDENSNFVPYCAEELGLAKGYRGRKTSEVFRLLQNKRDFEFGGYRPFHTSVNMAKSKFEYVKQFEVEDRCMPNCWIVIRIDGKSFHRFSDTHHFVKPNDERALGLMSRAAQVVMEDFKDVVLAYGQSDEYSFVFKKHTTMYNRRGSKIMTNLVSLFSSTFVMNWSRYFATQDLQYPPSFDARVVLYPSDENLKDYLSWRQADCHINNLYNTVFWKLVQERCLTPAQSQERLKGTLSSDKNEILFSEFNINYNNLPELYRKGTVLIRSREDSLSSSSRLAPTTNSVNHSTSKSSIVKYRSPITILNCDIIGQKFWEDHPEILDPKKG